MSANVLVKMLSKINGWDVWTRLPTTFLFFLLLFHAAHQQGDREYVRSNVWILLVAVRADLHANGPNVPVWCETPAPIETRKEQGGNCNSYTAQTPHADGFVGPSNKDKGGGRQSFINSRCRKKTTLLSTLATPAHRQGQTDVLAGWRARVAG